MPGPVDLHDALDLPQDDQATPVSRAQGRQLHDLVIAHGCKRTLEIGLGYGVSAAYVMTATGSRHIAVDPYQERYGHRGLANLRSLGLADRLVLVPEPSHVALPRLLDAGESADFVFVDGGHRFDEVFVDWYFSDLLLEDGGLVVLDDAWMPSVQRVTAFVRANRADYDELPAPDPNFLVFRRAGEDRRDWGHYVDF